MGGQMRRKFLAMASSPNVGSGSFKAAQIRENVIEKAGPGKKLGERQPQIGNEHSALFRVGAMFFIDELHRPGLKRFQPVGLKSVFSAQNRLTIGLQSAQSFSYLRFAEESAPKHAPNLDRFVTGEQRLSGSDRIAQMLEPGFQKSLLGLVVKSFAL